MNSVSPVAAEAAVLAAPGALTDRVRSLFSYAGTTNLSYVLAAVTLGLLFKDAVSPWALGAWSLAFAVVLLGRSWMAWSYLRAAPADDAASARWLKGWNLGTLASGALWGTLIGMLFLAWFTPILGDLALYEMLQQEPLAATG